jgi:hypothetical protein
MTMTPLQTAQVASALLVVITPLIVVQVAFRVARVHARATGEIIAAPSASTLLTWLSLGGVALVGIVGFAVPAAPSRLLLAAGVAFSALAAVALKTLAAIDQFTSSSRNVSASVRSASLVARRAAHYLPWTWRFAAYGIAAAGIATFVARALAPAAGRQLMQPVFFAAIALIFLCLYERWIHELITGPCVAVDGVAAGVPRRSIRGVFGMEVALLTGCLGAAHALLDLNWQVQGILGAVIVLVTTVLAIVGCALALSSDLLRRTYVPIRR